MKKFLALGLLALGGCADPVHTICESATDGLKYHKAYVECVHEAGRARWQAMHNAAQKWRNMPRKVE